MTSTNSDRSDPAASSPAGGATDSGHDAEQAHRTGSSAPSRLRGATRNVRLPAGRTMQSPLSVIGKTRPRATPLARRPDSAVVDCGLYVRGHRRADVRDYAEALRQARAEEAGTAFVWLGLHEPTFEEFAGIAETFGLHPLAVEDAVHAHQRPKLDLYADLAFLVVKTARYVEHPAVTDTSEIIETGEVMLFVGPDFLVTVRHGDACRLTPVRKHVGKHAELLRHGPWAVAYAIMDRIVDDYLVVADEVETDIDEVETGVFSARAYADVQRVYQLKRELLEMRRAVLPLVRPVGMLAAGEVDSVPGAVRSYYGDVADHLSRVTEQVHGFDELLTGLVQANLSRVGIQQNNDMRKISAWVAIAAVPTMIAGIYGMNFTYMPELGWHWGYPVTLVAMIAICLGLYTAFRKSGWL